VIVSDKPFSLDCDPTLPGHPDPYPLYHRLRQDDPVHWSTHLDGWVLTRHADAAAYLRDRRFSRAAYLDRMREKFGDQPILGLQAGELAFLDPPEHTWLKNLAEKLFTPQAITRLRPQIQAEVDRILDGVAERDGMDLVADFAYPIPGDVIAADMGVPREDWPMLRQWVEGVVMSRGLVRTAEMIAMGDNSAAGFSTYFPGLIERRRAQPEQDLLSVLVTAEEKGRRLDDQQLITLLEQLFAAGHGTTRNLIGNGVLALLRNPAELKRLRDKPELIATAVQEMLRYDSPTQAPSPQVALADVEIGGTKINKGQTVSVLFGAANRDPARFPDPDHFDITRRDHEHLAFSMGTHYCLGASLARAEAQIAIGTLIRRFTRLRLVSENVEWEKMGRFRGPRSLPVEF
jgi:pimeloyl-[acyl-carrier protein] synthase